MTPPDDPDELDDALDELEWLVDDWMDGDDDAEDEIAGQLRSLIHDDLLAVVGDGFVPLGDLVERFGPELRLDREVAGEILERYLRWWASGLSVSPSGIVAAEATVVEGTRFRHVVTAEEAASGQLGVGLDLTLLFDRIDLGEVAGLGPLRHIHPDAVEDESFDRHRVVEGPEGWLAGATAGDTIAVVRRGDECTIEVVDDESVDTTPIVDALVHARTSLVDRLPIDVYWLYKAAAIEAHGFGPDLGLPLSTLLTEAGWESRDDELAPVGFDWDTAVRERIAKGRQSVMARAGVEGLEMVEPIEALITELFGEGPRGASTTAVPVPDDRIRAVSALLARPGVAGSVFTLGLPAMPSESSLTSVLDVATSLLDRSDRSDVSGPARLGLLAAAELDRVDAIDDLLGPAHLNGSDDPVLCTIAGDLELDRGRLDVARRHYRRGGVRLAGATARVVDSAGDAFSAGRNEPCPCGSGHKFKRCHGAPGGPPLSDTDRARLLIARLEAHIRRRMDFGIHRWCRLAGLVVDDEWLTDDASLYRPLLETLAWFEEGRLAEYLAARGSLLPDADRALAESWSDAPIVVGIGDGDGLRLADDRLVSQTPDLGGLTSAGPPLGVVGRLVPIGGEPTVIRGAWVSGPMDELASRVAAAAADADVLAEVIGSTRPG